MLKKVFESLEWAEKPLVVLGALVAAKWVVKKLSNLSFFCSQQIDIVERYGKNSYAVITGGAQGIGKSFALDLATKGFNLILFDINDEQLQKTKQEIAVLSEQVLVKTVLIDFSKGTDPEFYKRIGEELANLDISILINNVGVGRGAFGYFEQLPIELMIKSFVVNLYPAVYMTKVLYQQMNLRQHKSLILNLSSASSLYENAYYHIYGSTKRFMTAYFESLYLEQKVAKTKVDVFTLTPYFVSTAIINFRKGAFIIEPDQLVQSTWKLLLRNHAAIGHWKHQLYHYLTYTMIGETLSFKFNKFIQQPVADRTTKATVEGYQRYIQGLKAQQQLKEEKQ